GISIGKSRAVPIDPIEDAIADYVTSFRLAKRTLEKMKGFVVVNVSSPNTKDLRAMQASDVAKKLLDAIAAENTGDRHVPVLLKIAPDLDDAALESLFEIVAASGIEGIVATNTTTSRDGLVTNASTIESIGAGGLSGPPLRRRSRTIVARARKKLGQDKTIIGVGGISDGASALAMLDAGADLLQLYTGMIYEGPFVARSIAREIAFARSMLMRG
ncbi:MAG: quinone-dependent dihydroorotate dehydrogenase, partial [Polyangiaceae bacterium]